MRILLATIATICSFSLTGQSLSGSYPLMINQIIQSLAPEKGETVMIRYDEGLMPELSTALADQMKPMVKSVELEPYGSVKGFKKRLAVTDIYIWMPVRTSVPDQPEQVSALVEWLDEGRGRQIHFHWGDGTRNWDSTSGKHNAAYDSVYLTALNINYDELKRQQQAAAGILRSGEVQVTSPAGTDLRFNVGNRTITLQDGDASAQRMRGASVRIEREIELPAGAIRVAPLEKTVQGTLAVGTGSIAGVPVEDLVLTIKDGIVVEVKATSGASEFQEMMRNNPGLGYFREIGIGFNPNLNTPDGYTHVPYYGYGQGVVRLSLGNNIEVGGAVAEAGVQWMFFLDTSVKVGDQYIVRDGQLQGL